MYTYTIPSSLSSAEVQRTLSNLLKDNLDRQKQMPSLTELPTWLIKDQHHRDVEPRSKTDSVGKEQELVVLFLRERSAQNLQLSLVANGNIL